MQAQLRLCDVHARAQLLKGGVHSHAVIRRHLASSEGSWSVAEWLLDNGSNINALDRFKRTPLEVRRLLRL